MSKTFFVNATTWHIGNCQSASGSTSFMKSDETKELANKLRPICENHKITTLRQLFWLLEYGPDTIDDVRWAEENGGFTADQSY